jgi:hypothetical protein
MFFAAPAAFVFQNNYLVNIAEELPNNIHTIQIAGNWSAPTETGTSVTIQNNVLEDSSTSGINLSNVRGDISNNIFSNMTDYGILIAGSPTLTITDNVFDGIKNPSPSPTSTAGVGIRFTEPAGSGVVTFTDNTFSNSYVGIAVRLGQSIAGMNVEISDNKFSNNTVNIQNNGNGTMNVEENYWGTADEETIAAKIDGPGKALVIFKPYYLNSALTVLSSENQVVIDNDETEPIVEVAPETPDIIVPEDPTGVTKIDVVVPSDVTDATVNVASLVNTGSSGVNNATLPARINITATTAIGQVFVDIPSNTVVSGDNWNGIINVPTIKPTNSVTVIPSTGNVVEEVLTVIEIRFDDIQLEFDNAVRILIPDMAGNLVGYSRADTSTPIDHICESDSQAAGDALSDGGDSKIDAGDDLAVWTKHSPHLSFTTKLQFHLTTRTKTTMAQVAEEAVEVAAAR